MDIVNPNMIPNRSAHPTPLAGGPRPATRPRWQVGLPVRQAGFTMIELLIAVAVLLIGIVAVAELIPAALRSNLRNRVDSTALIVAQRELDQMAAQPLNVEVAFGTGHYNFVDADGALTYLGSTLGANIQRNGCQLLTDPNGRVRIDFTLPANACERGYQRYVQWVWSQATGDTQTIDLRWHVITYNPGGFPARKIIVIAGRAVGGTVPPSLPANLQLVVGRPAG